jgi:hypothetical protein
MHHIKHIKVLVIANLQFNIDYNFLNHGILFYFKTWIGYKVICTNSMVEKIKYLFIYNHMHYKKFAN